MILITVGILFLFGILMLLLEMLVVPGKIFAGLVGIILIITGIVITYKNYGDTMGHMTILAIIIIIVSAIFFALKTGTWKKLMLKTEITSKASIDELSDKVNVGDIGTTTSRLAPMGKVFINEMFVEAKAINTFIDQNTEVEVTKVLNTNIIVKPKNS